MNPKPEIKFESQRGMALISALLAMTMLLALGMAVVLSATTDTVTNKSARLGNQAFFAADAGIGIARKAMEKAFRDRLAQLQTDLASGAATPYIYTLSSSYPATFQVLPDPDSTAGQSCTFYSDIRTNAQSLTSVAARNSRLDALNSSAFTVTISPFSGTLSVSPSMPAPNTDLTLLPNPSTTPAGQTTTWTQNIVFRYMITVTGTTHGGASAQVSEVGRLSSALVFTYAPASALTRSFSFSGFGAFFDNGDTQASAPLASGTFSGPVHTNTHFAFSSARSVAFRNVVSQVDTQIRYDNTSNTTPNHAIPTTDITGIDISAEGYRGGIAPVPLPTNTFSQEYAVINGTGITDLRSDGTPVDPPAATSGAVFDAQGRVTAATLAANLRNASGNAPNINAGAIANGVYVSSSNGTSVQGAGIYVKGNADDIQLKTNSNGDQLYVITQGSTVTTITVNYASSTTTIAQNSPSRSTTLTGLFTDRADPNNVSNGTMLYVDGAISSLRGGSVDSSVVPAIAANTQLTVTAKSDITVTGELKYQNAVVASDGTPVSGVGSIKNVLGLFTNDGNINLAPNDHYVSGSGLSLEMDAAVVAFNANTSNDGGSIEGSIVYTGGTSPGSSDRWKLVGSRVQSKINSIGFTYRDIFFDTRFSGGTFSPPFFPGTHYALAPVPAVGTLTMNSFATPAATAMSWFRTSN